VTDILQKEVSKKSGYEITWLKNLQQELASEGICRWC